MPPGFQSAHRAREAELGRLTDRRWRELPDAAKTENQVSGVRGIACGATHGILERCNYACTSCYLTDVANRTPALDFEAVCAQLDALRAYLGPGGKAQITSGEVTLLPLEELGRILAYALRIGLDPMVMTNGERFGREPEYLVRLVREYGLRKISIHVDVTQRGRPELREGMRERDLHPVRDAYAELVRRVRREAGAHLHAAQTVTVTPQNLEDVPDVVSWALRNADAFRILSFQPLAAVGRTRDEAPEGIEADALWERICRPMGRTLNPDVMRFGHPACNVTVPVVVARVGERTRVFELIRRESRRDVRAFARWLRDLAPVVEVSAPPTRVARRVAGALVRHPRAAASVASYAVRRAWSDRGTAAAVALGAVTGRRPRVHPQLFVIHRFMDAGELATPLGRERLDACVFRVPVDGRMVSMCELNATELRRNLNERMTEGAGSSA